MLLFIIIPSLTHQANKKDDLEAQQEKKKISPAFSSLAPPQQQQQQQQQQPLLLHPHYHLIKMLSVIGLTDAVHTAFKALQKGENRVAIFKLDPNSKSKMEIELDYAGSSDSTQHEDIASLLPSDDCRYVFFNLDYMEGLGKRSKTFFVLWVPSDAKTKSKMVYASCAVPLKSKLGIICLSVQTGTTDAIEYDALVERCKASFK